MAALSKAQYDQMVALNEKKRINLESIMLMALELSELLDRDEEPEAILLLLDKRQALIDEISASQAELEPLVRTFMASEEDSEERRGLLDDLIPLLEGIAQKDVEIRSSIVSRHEAYQEELRRNSLNSRAISKYNQGVDAVSSELFDKKQ